MHEKKRIEPKTAITKAIPTAILMIFLSSAFAETTGATVVYKEGVLSVDGKPVEIGAKVPDGALLSTDVNGLAEIVFADKNAFRVGPATTFRVRLEKKRRSLEIERGPITAVLRKLDKATGGSMNVRTPSLVAGVRGTSFCVWVSGSKQETFFCTCNGRIEFIPGGTQRKILKEARHHEALTFSGAGKYVTVTVPDPQGNLWHDDSNLESLAARIGETMDWTRIED